MTEVGEARRWTLNGETAMRDIHAAAERDVGLRPLRVREDLACEEDVRTVAKYLAARDLSTPASADDITYVSAAYLDEAKEILSGVFGGPDDNE